MDCLETGYEAPNGDLSTLKSQWLRYNHDLSKEVKAMTVDKRSGIYKSVCACAPKKNSKEWRDNAICKAHLFVYKNKVTSIQLEHQCTDENPGRKRQYSVAMISLASDEIRDYQGPTRERGMAVQMYAETARAAGFELGKAQAYKVLQTINQDPLETHIGQFFLLGSILKAWKRMDPTGTFEMDTLAASWNNDLDSFHRLYVTPSFAKHAWKHCQMRFLTLNSSFQTGGRFNHTVFLAVTYDANDDILLLAVGICGKEEESNWVWFLHQLMRDFPGIQIVLSSSKLFMESKEIDGLLKLIAAQRCWCIRKLFEESPEKLSKSEQGSAIELAQASTPQLYRAFLQNFHKENTSVATWFDNRKEVFAAHVFLEAGKTRFCKVEDRVAENETIQDVLKTVSERPIATFIITLLHKWTGLHQQRKQVSMQPEQISHGLCKGAYNVLKEKQAQAAQHHVQLVYNKRGLWKGYVAFGKNDQALHRMLVSADVECYEFKCPCQQGFEVGCPCVHAAALLAAKNLNTDDARWFHERYHSSTQQAVYSPTHFPDFTDLKNKLKVEQLAPPDINLLPSVEKRKFQSAGINSSNSTIGGNGKDSKVCRACGERGHQHKTCQYPSTEYQFERFGDKAKKWATEQEDVKALP